MKIIINFGVWTFEFLRKVFDNGRRIEGTGFLSPFIQEKDKISETLSSKEIVQSLNSSFFPPHIGAEPGWAKRRVQDNLHAHARNEPINNY